LKTGHPQFEPRWPNTKAIKVGWLAGRGNQSPDIARILADGTTEETIRTMLQRAELERVGRNRNVVYVPIGFSTYERAALGKRAAAHGITFDDWVRRVAVSAGIPQDIYAAIVPEDE